VSTDDQGLKIGDGRIQVAEEGPFKIWIEKGVPDEIVEFLNSVRFGTEGAIYEHLYTEDRVANLHDPYLCYATEGDKLVACIVVERMLTEQKGIPVQSFYIRYFAANPEYKGRGITKKLSVIFIDRFRAMFDEKTIFYAVVEDGNIRSTKIVNRVGYKPLAKIRTIGFSRFFPRVSKRVERLSDPQEREKHLVNLRAFYADYILVHFNHVFLKNDYFVIREQGEIVAGLQMHRAFWRVTSMPGLSGKILLKVLPHLPLMNKMFNPRKFEFITFEGLYFKEGHEDTLFELIEGLLAQEKLKTAIFWLAKESPIYRMILERGKLGLMHQFVKNANTYIAFDSKHLTEEEQEIIHNYPPFISSFDFI
jgi:hypothetical protein